jgi:hypothetical protein
MGYDSRRIPEMVSERTMRDQAEIAPSPRQTTHRQIVLPWFRRDDYDRIRNASLDLLPSTYAEWERQTLGQLCDLAGQRVRVEKVIILSDQLVAFAQALNEDIDATTREALAAALLVTRQWNTRRSARRRVIN